MLSYSDLDSAIMQYNANKPFYVNTTPPLIAVMEEILASRQQMPENANIKVRNSSTCLSADEHILIAPHYKNFRHLNITILSFTECATAYAKLDKFGLLTEGNLKKIGGGISYFQLLIVLNQLEQLDLLNKDNIQHFINVYSLTASGNRNNIIENIHILWSFKDIIKDLKYRQLIFDKITDPNSNQSTIKHLLKLFNANKMYSQEKYIQPSELNYWLPYFNLVNKVNDEHLSDIVDHLVRNKTSKVLAVAIYQLLGMQPWQAETIYNTLSKAPSVTNSNYQDLIHECYKAISVEEPVKNPLSNIANAINHDQKQRFTTQNSVTHKSRKSF